MKMNKTFKILSVDGGGIRGIFSAHILKRIEDEYNIKLKDHFDLIAGTSTGAIIAGSVACGIDLGEVVNLYKNKGKDIFPKSWIYKIPVLKKLGEFPLTSSKYDKKNLKKILDEKFKNIKLGEVDKPLIIPSSDIANGKVFVFKSQYDKDFVRDKNTRVADAILCSCSAPIYFNPSETDNYLLADGGLWANNPSLISVIDAKRRLGINFSDIKIFSIGTGLYKPEYNMDVHKNKKKRWGAINGWKGLKLLDLIMSLQAQSVHNYLSLLLKPEQIKRLSFESEQPLPLDETTCVDKFLSKADSMFTYEATKIKEFLEIK